MKNSRSLLLILVLFFVSFGLCKAVGDERSISITINNVPQESKQEAKNEKVDEGSKNENKVEEKKTTSNSNTLKSEEPNKNVENKTKEEVKPSPPKVENKEKKAPVPKKKKSSENKNEDVSTQQNLDTPSIPALEEKAGHPTLPENLNDKKNLEEIPDSINDGLEKRSYVIRGIISMMLVVAGAVLLVIVIVSGYEKKNKKTQ